MEWLIKGVIIWFSIDVVLIATCWYLSFIGPRFWPDWWKAVIVDDTLPYEIEGVVPYGAEFNAESISYSLE